MATIVVKESVRECPPRTEAVRVWLYRHFFTSLCGVTFRDWCQILRENRGAIDPPYWSRAALTSVGSLLNSYYRWREDRAFGAAVDAVALRPPVFILGHWRSGTTLLHNLLALDDQFAYPNLYEVFFPHTFLGTEESRLGLARTLIPHTRVFDNVPQGAQMPNEDEFATCALSLCSPYMAWCFPRHAERYDRYLTFEGVPEAEVTRWKGSLVHFLKKLTVKFDRPILLKSPPHTCRIKLLLELFPDARFVHIRRNPFAVFRSTQHLYTELTRSLQFQRPRADDDLDGRVLRRYRVMHDAYFAERDLIPEGHFHELAFEDLELDPVGQIRKTYEALQLPDFEVISPHLEDYVGSLSGYRKNDYPDLPPSLRRRIVDEWGRSFEEWGYRTD